MVDCNNFFTRSGAKTVSNKTLYNWLICNTSWIVITSPVKSRRPSVLNWVKSVSQFHIPCNIDVWKYYANISLTTYNSPYWIRNCIGYCYYYICGGYCCQFWNILDRWFMCYSMPAITHCSKISLILKKSKHNLLVWSRSLE